MISTSVGPACHSDHPGRVEPFAPASAETGCSANSRNRQFSTVSRVPHQFLIALDVSGLTRPNSACMLIVVNTVNPARP